MCRTGLMPTWGRMVGFSLFELIMVIIIFSILAAVAAPLMVVGFQAYFTGKGVADVDWQARVALERMTRDLRTIRSPASLVITSGSDISFTDADGNVIRYCMGTVGTCPGAAGELSRNAQPLATSVTALAFSFLTQTGVATVTPAQVFYVTVNFTATNSTTSKAYQATVSPRNFP